MAPYAADENPWASLLFAFLHLLVACLLLLNAAVSLLTAKLIRYFAAPHPCALLGLPHDHGRPPLCDLHRRLLAPSSCVECLRLLPLYTSPPEAPPGEDRYVRKLYDRESVDIHEDQMSIGKGDGHDPEGPLRSSGPTLADRCVKRKFAKVFVEERSAAAVGEKAGKGGEDCYHYVDGESLVDGQGEPGNGNGRTDADVSVESVMAAFQAEKDALGSLYEELEEERNASAVAANEAMAMITRLQEEKAAVQMEARQYQRMVEEKAVYDQEAITLLKEILFKREQERFVLEKEVESYRKTLLSRDDWAEPGDSPLPLTLTFQTDRVEGTNLLSNFESAWSDKGDERNKDEAEVGVEELQEEVAVEDGEAEKDEVEEEGADMDMRTSSMVMRDNFKLAMEDDIRELTSRLQVLEDDRKLMKQIVHSIKAEKQELRELAQNLRELRVHENGGALSTVPQVWSLGKKRKMEQQEKDLAGL